MSHTKPPRLKQLRRTRMSVTSSIGRAWTTAVASGVRPRKTKALGPEKETPAMVAVLRVLRFGVGGGGEKVCLVWV